MYRVILTDAAKTDIREIKQYFGLIDAGLKKRFQSEFKAIISKLREKPLIFGERHNEFRIANLRKFQFQIQYHVEQKLVVIVAVTHAKRNPDFAKRRKK